LRDKIGMAIIWITHDLGIMAGLAERMMVMYAGFFVEKAPVKVLYGDPRHPYTSGLLKSLPRMDQRRGGTRLIPIFGRPPDLVSLPEGCPFLARCRYSIERCAHENPQLVEIEPDHEIACWVDVRTAETHEVVA
jgi:oligopeptide transport system ATP-binding protein